MSNLAEAFLTSIALATEVAKVDAIPVILVWCWRHFSNAPALILLLSHYSLYFPHVNKDTTFKWF